MEREEAINYLKKVLGFSPVYDEAFYTLFPELKESGDERIGNVIYCIVRDNKEVKRILEGNGVSVNNALSYLEKQKEQKPALTPERLRPKFAVGDTICHPMRCDHTVREIYIRCKDPVYVCVNEEGLESHIPFSEQDEWERKEQEPEGVQGVKGTPGLAGIKAVEGVVHHVANAHYIVTNQKQLNARLREIPEGTKVKILICEIKEESYDTDS